MERCILLPPTSMSVINNHKNDFFEKIEKVFILTYPSHRTTKTATGGSIVVQQAAYVIHGVKQNFMVTLYSFIILTMQYQFQCITHACGLSAQCSNESFIVLYI
jgi:shikimate kinase